MHTNRRMHQPITQRFLPLLAAAAICILAITPAMSAGPGGQDRNGSLPGLGWGAGGSRGTPGPIAGAGLPFLIGVGAIGVYRRIRRWRKESPDRQEEMKQG